MNNPVNYFIYARKSSEGADRQILSIEGQLGELQKVIEREGLNIVGTYTESKSAHLPNNRPAFNEMVKKISIGQANGIIVWHINRISRNPKESGEIQQLLQDGKIVSIITPYRHFRSEDNALLFSIETSEANQYSRDLSVNVKRGLRQKYEMGHPPGYAQLGYLNTKSNIRGSNKIIVDPERWQIVRKGFEMVLSGAYTVNQALDELNNKYGLRTRPGNLKGGKPLSKSGFYRMLINPFFYGYFYRKGVLYKGSYKPMITVAEYDCIQEILGRNGRPRNQQHVFAFTGLMQCGSCGGAITASRKRKLIKTTGQFKIYTLYHCTHRKKTGSVCTERSCIPVEDIEKSIISELNNYQIRLLFKDWAINVAKENYQSEIDKSETILKNQKGMESKLRQELSNLVDLRISNGINEEMYLIKKTEKEGQLLRVQEKTKAAEKINADWIKLIEEKLTYAVDIVTRFSKGDDGVKKEICLDFGSNWVLKDKKLFITKHEWLEPVRKFNSAVEDVLRRFEPKKTLTDKEQTIPPDTIRPFLCGLVNEVRTRLRNNNNSYSTNPP